MDLERRSLRFGIWMIALAAVLRLAGGGLGGQVRGFFSRPETASFLLYLHSGRVLRPMPEQTEPSETQPAATKPSETLPTHPVMPDLPSFRREEISLVEITWHSSYRPELEDLLCAPLSWNLTGDEPTVLIFHSHATESYTPSAGEDYKESSAYRTLDTDYNMVSVGDHLATLLRQQGIVVVHDRTLHDEPSYSGAYSSSRKSVQALLEQYPSIRLVIDLHRDALSLDSGKQLDTHALVDGRDSAQLMMVVGTDDGGLTHPCWRENLALALKLHVLLERDNPGITRPISFRTQRFNQDLSPGAMLIEVGAAGDIHTEALTAAEALAAAIAKLALGSR